MKRLVYIAFIDFDNKADGVVKKIKMQMQGMEKNGYTVECIAYGSGGIIVWKGDSTEILCPYATIKPRRFLLLNKAAKYIEHNKTETLYMRFAFSDWSVCRFFKEAKKTTDKIVVEVATYPCVCAGTFKTNKKVWAMSVIDKLTFIKMSQFVDLYYTIGKPVTNLGGRRTINIPNGIQENNYKKKKVLKQTQLQIMCIASMYAYQGYDRLILGLARYKSLGGERDIMIHLVGEGPELEKYRKLIRENKLQNEVICHGPMHGEKLDDLFDVCDLACSALAPHRGQIVYASSLKNKEYMLRGIPFIYAYEEIGIPVDFDYLLRVETSELPMDINEILSFYDSYANKKEEYATSLREFALENFQWQNILKEV